MKGGLSLIKYLHNDKGFVFPILFFISIFVILMIVMNLTSLQSLNETLWTKEEQLRINTLYYNSYNDLINLPLENIVENGDGNQYFFYPDGNVHVKLTAIPEKNVIDSTFIVRTMNHSEASIQISIPMD